MEYAYNLKNVLAIWSNKTCGWLCSWTTKTPSTVLLIPSISYSFCNLFKRAATEGSSSGCGSLTPNL